MAGSPETLKARTAFQRLGRNGSAVLPELQQPRRACGTCRKDKTQLHLGAKCSVCARRTATKGCLRKGTEYPWPAATNFSLFSCDVGSAPALAAKRSAPAAATSASPAPSPPKRSRRNPRRLMTSPTAAHRQDRPEHRRRGAGESHGSCAGGGESITLRLRLAQKAKRALQARSAAAAAAAAEVAAAVDAEEQLLGDTGLNFRQIRALGLAGNDWCL